MLTKISFLFFYFCCHIETEDIKDKLPKSGRIFLGFAKPLVPRVGLEPTLHWF